MLDFRENLRGSSPPPHIFFVLYFNNLQVTEMQRGASTIVAAHIEQPGMPTRLRVNRSPRRGRNHAKLRHAPAHRSRTRPTLELRRGACAARPRVLTAPRQPAPLALYPQLSRPRLSPSPHEREPQGQEQAVALRSGGRLIVVFVADDELCADRIDERRGQRTLTPSFRGNATSWDLTVVHNFETRSAGAADTCRLLL